jgi:hypothetical protein
VFEGEDEEFMYRTCKDIIAEDGIFFGERGERVGN